MEDPNCHSHKLDFNNFFTIDEVLFILKLIMKIEKPGHNIYQHNMQSCQIFKLTSILHIICWSWADGQAVGTC